MSQVKYPTADDIIAINKMILERWVAKKADRHELISKQGLETILKEVRNTQGDIYDKAVAMLFGFMKMHVFVSGMRRTTLVSTAVFMEMNEVPPPPRKQSRDALQGIREGFYTKDEIKSWLQGNEIRPFKRR